MSKQRAVRLSEQARKLGEAGKLNKAIACYRQAIELDAKVYNYYYQLGNLLLEYDLVVQAKLYFEQAIELDYHNSWAYYSLGKTLAKQGEIQAAIDAYKKAIALKPDFFYSHYELGQIFYSQNQLDKAIDCYQKALQLNSEYSWAHYFLAEILAKKEEINLAIAHYRQAAKLNPDFYKSHYELGRNLQRKRQYQEAINCYLKVIELEPQHFWSYYYLGEAFAATQRSSQAIDYYEQAIEFNPQYLSTYFRLGQILLAQGPQAIADYRASLKTKSQLWQIYFELGLGQAWEQQGNFDIAIDCYINAVKIDPKQELPYKILQYIKITPQKITEIILFYQELTNNNSSLDLAWGNLGDVFTQAGQLDKAILCYRNSCYYNAVARNSELAKLNWESKKQQAPNFIIIGAAKSGTTSLFAYLQQHPQVLLPHKKEINFFDKYFDQGLDWYLAHFPSITDSQKLITGEATTQYIFTPEVEHRIYNAFADIKIIIMLRNPINRTISDYYHHVNRGLETRTLQTIISQTKKRLSEYTEVELAYTINEFDYILKSIYFWQICRWQEIFPNNNILIIESEAFFTNTSDTMKNIWSFLELDSALDPIYMKYNVGNYESYAGKIRQDLQNIFAPYNHQLAEYLNLKFSWQL